MKKLRIIFLMFIFYLSSILSLFAHECWIDFSNSERALTKGQLTVKVSNGHAFPKSMFAIEQRVINYIKVIKPDGNSVSLKTYKEGNCRAALLTSLTKGTYIVLAGLKNPPRYFLKSIISIGECSKIDFNAGETFEIVPKKCPLKLKKGDSVVLKVFFKGKGFQSALTFSINGEKNFSTSTDRKGEYKLRITSTGKYLITSSLKGKTCSLTFEIK